jgi:hypothetical protein
MNKKKLLTDKNLKALQEAYNRRNSDKFLMECFIDEKTQDRYYQRMFEMDSLDESSLIEDGDSHEILQMIDNNEFEVNNNSSFLKSLKSGKRIEYLIPYTLEHLNQMTTYKLKGYDAGFAVKADGDIVSVHNNTGISGIGEALIKAAIRVGGYKLDHFDGWLTGFYSRLQFKVDAIEDWNDDYTPPNWKYEPIDIFNPLTSVYASELAEFENYSQIPEKLKRKIIQYREGKPDIIYRKL